MARNKYFFVPPTWDLGRVGPPAHPYSNGKIKSGGHPRVEGGPTACVWGANAVNEPVAIGARGNRADKV